MAASTNASPTDNQTKKTLSAQNTDITHPIQLKAKTPQTDSAIANAHSKVTASAPAESISSTSINNNNASSDISSVTGSNTSSDTTIQRNPDTDITQQSADIAFHPKTSESPSAPDTIQKKSSASLASVSQNANEVSPAQSSVAASEKVASAEGNATTQSIAEHPVIQAKSENHGSQSVKPNQQLQRISSTDLSVSNTLDPVTNADHAQQTIQSAEQLIQRMSDRTQEPESRTQTTAADIPHSQQAVNPPQSKTPPPVERTETTTPLIQTKPVAHSQKTTDTKAALAKPFSASENPDLSQNKDAIRSARETVSHRTLPSQQQIRSQPPITKNSTPPLNPSNESIQRQTISPGMSPVIETPQQSPALDNFPSSAREKLSDAQSSPLSSSHSSSSPPNSNEITTGEPAAIAQPTSIARSHTNISQPTHTDIQRQGASESITAEPVGNTKASHSVDRSHSTDAIAPSSALPESHKTTDTAVQRSSASAVTPPITEELSQQPADISQATAALTDSTIQTKPSQQKSDEASPQNPITNADSVKQTANAITEPITSMPSSEVTSQRKVNIATTEKVNVGQPQQIQAVEHSTLKKTPALAETAPVSTRPAPNVTETSKSIQRQTALSSNSNNVTAAPTNASTNHSTNYPTAQPPNQVPIENTAVELVSTAPQAISQQTSSSSVSVQKQTDHKLVSEKAEPQKSNPEHSNNSALNTDIPNIQAGSTSEILTQNTQTIQRNKIEHTQAIHKNSNTSKRNASGGNTSERNTSEGNASNSNGSKAINEPNLEHSAVKPGSADILQTTSDIVQTRVDNHHNTPTTTPTTQPPASNTIQRIAELNDSLIQPDSIPTHPSVSTHHPTEKTTEKLTKKPTEKPLVPPIQRSTNPVLSIKGEDEASLEASSEASATAQSQGKTAADQPINLDVVKVNGPSSCRWICASLIG
ncbi:MAG: hypothetical protein AAFY33_04100 [Cyanobacteria bacterium J06643_4]